MSGYAAAARISGASPRLVSRPAGLSDRGDPPLSLRRIAVPVPDQLDVVVIQSCDRAGSAFVGRRTLGERWDAFRERWSQLTFYLSSGDAWR